MNHRVPIVEITWRDAQSEGNQWDYDDDLEIDDTIMVTVGFEIKRTDKFVIVAHSINTTGKNQSNGRMQIPLNMIISQRSSNDSSKKPVKK